jgi:NAD-dependent dihydropyrimidine dehydrogenase PreA subunit
MITILEETCTGCETCVLVCPHGVLAMEDGVAVPVHEDRCIECGACKLNCHDGAVEVTRGAGCLVIIVKEDILKIAPKGGSCGCNRPQGWFLRLLLKHYRFSLPLTPFWCIQKTIARGKTMRMLGNVLWILILSCVLPIASPAALAVDTDGDGIPDEEDNCPGVHNPCQTDYDDDGCGNLCDVCIYVYDPMQFDYEGDGAGDECDCAPGELDRRPPPQVEGLTLGIDFQGATVLNWSRPVGGDKYWVHLGFVDQLYLWDYGHCLVGGLPHTTYADFTEVSPGEPLFFLIQGESDPCGAGFLGFAPCEYPRPWPNLESCDQPRPRDASAARNETIRGFSEWTFWNTVNSDDNCHTVTEEVTSGSPSKRTSLLEQHWKFYLFEGTRFEFYIEAFRTPSSELENFEFSYSVDDRATWTPLVLEDAPFLEDGNLFRFAPLPPDISGAEFWLRVVDTDRTPGNQGVDHLSIDCMFVRIYDE